MLWRLISRFLRAGHRKSIPAVAGPEGASQAALGEWLRRGEALKDQAKFAAALECYRACAALDPGNLAARGGIAHVLSAAWRMEECIEACEDALRVSPTSAEIFSGYLLYSHYAARPDARALFARHARYGELMSAAAPALYRHAARREDTGRTLRLGYVSRDFCRHSVASFIEPVIEHHDSSGFKVYCYYTRADTDTTTERLVHLADEWRDACADSPDALAAKIRADGIDILVDLGGHTIGNSLAAFSRRPAPVQCTWLGYPDTTGLRAMDYRITDGIVDPAPEADALNTERLLRVAPPFVCYQPPVDAPPVEARKETRALVFGSFNAIMKVNEPLIESWARILASIPHSRLVMKSTLLEYDETALRVRARFAAQGIPPDRLELRCWADSRAEHLAAYNEIDIALDTWPYNGTTTTCEALWMGVPVVTLSGALHMSRVGETLLACAGLHELVAKDPEQYVAIAVALARDTSRRATLTTGMRQRLAASPLLEHAAFTRKLENAYRTAWSAWCETEVDTAPAGSRAATATSKAL